MIERLLDLVGNTYLYQNKEFKIEKVKRINSSYVIITNKKIFNFYEAEAFKFVNELKQTTNKVVSKENKNISKQEPKRVKRDYRAISEPWI